MDFGDIFMNIIGTTLPGFDTTFNIILFGDFYATFTITRFMFWELEAHTDAPLEARILIPERDKSLGAHIFNGVLTWTSLLSIYTYFMNKFTYVLRKIVMTLYGRDRSAASASKEGIGVPPQPPIYTYCRSSASDSYWSLGVIELEFLDTLGFLGVDAFVIIISGIKYILRPRDLLPYFWSGESLIENDTWYD